MPIREALLSAACVVAMCGSVTFAHAQVEEDVWTGSVEQGGLVEVRGVNGSIRVLPSDDRQVRMEARREGRRSDTGTVSIEVVEHDGGVTFCALYPTPPRARHPNVCEPGGESISVEDNDVRVDFTVWMPAGVHLSANTVNGEVDIEGMRGDVEAASVNGDIRIVTTGRVSEATTVNGDVFLSVPEGLDANFSARTVNGTIESDFPITISGRVGPRRLQGTIGGGGPELRIATVNGDVRLRRN